MSNFSKLNLAIDNSKNGFVFAEDVIFDKKTIKRFCVFKDYNDITKTFLNNGKKEWNFYEIFLENKKCNFIQDLDIKDTEGLIDPVKRLDNIIEITSNSLQEYLSLQKINIDLNTDLTIIILESPPTDKKASYHIIYRIKDYYFQNLHIGCKNFYEWMIKEKNQVLLGVDSIYTKNRLFRILNSCKLEHPGQKLKTKYTGNLLNTLGTYIDYKVTDKLIQNLTIKKPVKIIPIIELEENNLDVVDNLLNCLKSNWYIDYEMWNKLGILLYCIYKGDIIGKEKWDTFSKRCVDKYNKTVIETFWINYELLDIRMSIGSLHYYAKADNMELYESNRKLLYKDTFFLDASHTNIAKLFCNRFNDTFIYNNKSWHQYNKNSGIWSIEENDFCIRENLAKLSYEIRDSKILIKELKDENIEQINLQNKLKDSISSKLLNVSFKDSVIKELLWMMYVKETDFNNNPYVFAFTNGVYDFKKMIFRPGNYEEYIVNTTGYKYIYEDSSKARLFIDDIIPDVEVQKYYLMIIASHFIDYHFREEFFVLYGRKGCNGKSTLTNAEDAVFGNFFYSCKSNILTEQKFDNTEGASPTICNMENKRLISFQEISGQAVLENTMIKMLSGGDKINGRKLYGDTKEFYINGLQQLSCNELPAFNKVDGAIIRRMRCIKMETEFVNNITEPHHRLIKDIDIKSLKFSFFQLLIEHYNSDIKKGIQNCPEKIRKTTENYFETTDSIIRFINKYIVKDDNAFFTKNQIEEIIKFKDVSREYEFYNKKHSQVITSILEKLNVSFIDRKKINNRDYRYVIMGYKIDLEQDYNIED